MNKVVGILGIRTKDCIFNADMDGYPKKTPTGEIYLSDKSIKYAFKDFWNRKGKIIFGLKSYKFQIKTKEKKKEITDSIKARTLPDRYSQLFPTTDTSKHVEVVNDLYSCIDIKQFGSVCTLDKFPGAFTGVVQFSIFKNLDKESAIWETTIQSPFSSGDDKNQSTLGTMVYVNETHCFGNFTINPDVIFNIEEDKKYKKDGTHIEYTTDDFNDFKEASLSCVTELTSCSKLGAENEFALFIYCKDGVSLSKQNLNEFLSFEKTDDLKKLNVDKLVEYLKTQEEKIESIEVNYDKFTLDLDEDKLKELNNLYITPNMEYTLWGK